MRLYGVLVDICMDVNHGIVTATISREVKEQS